MDNDTIRDSETMVGLVYMHCSWKEKGEAGGVHQLCNMAS